MLLCGCGRWMHTEGVDERLDESGAQTWLVRTECHGCGLRVGLEASPDQVGALVDRLMWTDEAHHVLDRLPPYIEPLLRHEVEDYARSKGQQVVTFALLAQARHGGAVVWEPEAERRLENIPSPVRAMARVELERTAAEKGQSEVTVSLMEEVKAKYFGLSGVMREA